MGAKGLVRAAARAVPGHWAERLLQARRYVLNPPKWHHDGLAVWGKDTSFMRDPAFVEAYAKGMGSGHKIARTKDSKADIHIEWRVHAALWAARHAVNLPGDFVECGVNTGILSLAICDYLDFNSLDKSFWLFDTYRGIPEEQMSEQEKALAVAQNEQNYEEVFDLARRNFSPYPRAKLVRGKVPDTLREVVIERVCYLSIDMNLAEPEIAAVEHFWPRLAPGAPVLLDDYAWLPHGAQKEAMDRFASEKGVGVLNLPTGQGLILKP